MQTYVTELCMCLSVNRQNLDNTCARLAPVGSSICHTMYGTLANPKSTSMRESTLSRAGHCVRTMLGADGMVMRVMWECMEVWLLSAVWSCHTSIVH